VTSLALDLKKLFASKTKRPPFLGLLTRAEEVGFIGAIGHFELGWLKGARRELVFVSLETSRTLPGAEIGKGPVVRQGDKFTVFDAGALRVFSELAQAALPERHQKRVMDGGTCEGTTAMVYGYRTVGISVPLGNYHNQCFEGGPDSRGPNGPAPEFVHRQDIAGLIKLCHALLEPRKNWDAPWKAKRSQFRKELASYRPLLRSGP
jgi:endoglucanase